MNRIKEKKYYRIEFKLASPLMLGARQQERTDKDLLLDSCGQPVIPGSALTGIYRSMISMDEKKQRKYFGYVPKYEDLGADSENISSRILIYDAHLKNKGTYSIIRRDFVALDEYKTAIEGGKFDTEILEPGAEFITYIEQNLYEGDDTAAEEILMLWRENRIMIGAKTMRGYGCVEDVKIMQASFLLEDPECVKRWLRFDMFSEEGWEEWNSHSEHPVKKKASVKLELKLIDAISIRRYTTSVPENKKIPACDQEQMTVRRNGNEVPVIPGTTWAGAFKSHMAKMKFPANLDDFGYVRGKKKCKSKIRFSESEITGGTKKILCRNAIDRFTAGTVERALFTENIHYGGTTELEISFDGTVKQELLHSLAAAITDLHFGFLAIGGETSIGHGLFEIVKADGIKLCVGQKAETEWQTLYEKMAALLIEKVQTEELAYETAE